MNIGFWNFYDQLSRNDYLFHNRDAPIGEDLLLPFVRLYELATAKGIRLVTLDVAAREQIGLDAIVGIDFPYPVNFAQLQNVPQYLITFEPPVVKRDNWVTAAYGLFAKVFTWSDHHVAQDPSRFVKVNYAVEFPSRVPRNARGKLLVMMAGNKRSDHPVELYSARREAIGWFERNHPTELDLYGPGWQNLRTYRGFVTKKRDTLSQYKFSICYENARELPGYITEKMLDCFCAGTVPIYWGAPNVTDWIPAACFIDKRKYESYDELYRYLSTMPREEYLRYLDAIDAFIDSRAAYAFTTHCFAETILKEIVG